MSAQGELVELLAKALKRAQRGANDRGILNRLRDVAEPFMDEPSPDYVRGDWAPHKLWQSNNDWGAWRANPLGQATWNGDLTAMERYRAGLFPENWNLNPESQAKLDALPPLTRAQFLAEHGEAASLSPYERAVLRRANPKEAARMLWNLDTPIMPALAIGAGFGGGVLTLRQALADHYAGAS